jgi:hypothetical protein
MQTAVATMLKIIGREATAESLNNPHPFKSEKK